MGTCQLEVRVMRNRILKAIVTAVLSIAVFHSTNLTNFSHGENVTQDTVGKLYVFDKNNEYVISSAKSFFKISSTTGYGHLQISGDIEPLPEVNGFPAYEIVGGHITLGYELDGTVFENNGVNNLFIENDRASTVDNEQLDSRVNSGVFIVQSSFNGKDWSTDTVETDIARKYPKSLSKPYTTNNFQETNGCYYRVIIAYGLKKNKNDSKDNTPTAGKTAQAMEALDKVVSPSVGLSTVAANSAQYLLRFVSNNAITRFAEVYEFYAVNHDAKTRAESEQKTEQTKILSDSPQKTALDNGFYGNEKIGPNDPHYGWELGEFYIKGFRGSRDDTNTFFRSVGDRVVLCFKLKQNIHRLNNKEDLFISNDIDGYDQNFQITRTNFKRGAFIIRHTNSERKKTDPIIYTDFLAARMKTTADTEIVLYEEGDYEATLDYEIKDTSGFKSKYSNYRMSFKFSIRDSNTSFFIFDEKTGEELFDKSFTPNGIIIDCAGSKFIEVHYERSVLNKNVLDSRENDIAKDKGVLTKGGVYKLWALDPYSEAIHEKTIYVGDEGQKYNRLKYVLGQTDEKGDIENSLHGGSSPVKQHK